MAQAMGKPVVTVNVAFEIDEGEARALYALSAYGDDAFIRAFYERLGKTLMQDHEQDLRRFLNTIRDVVGPAITQVDKARELVKGGAA